MNTDSKKIINRIVKLLKCYSSEFDGCISPNDFKDIAIDIHNAIVGSLIELPEVKHET